MTDDPEAEYEHPVEAEPIEGVRATCPDCGSQLLGRGTLTHNDDGSHGWTPDVPENREETP